MSLRQPQPGDGVRLAAEQGRRESGDAAADLGDVGVVGLQGPSRVGLQAQMVSLGALDGAGDAG